MSNHGLPHSVVKRFKRQLWEQSHKKLCPICDKPLPGIDKSTIDHIIPVSKGGTNEVSNLQLTHEKCNNLKGNHQEFKVIHSKYIKPKIKISKGVNELVDMINQLLKRSSNRTIQIKV